MKALVLLSGGMDSGVLLAQSLTEFDSVDAISFEYGSKHNHKELESAALLAKKYGVTHTVVPLRFLDELFDSSLLQGGEPVRGIGAHDLVEGQQHLARRQMPLTGGAEEHVVSAQ